MFVALAAGTCLSEVACSEHKAVDTALQAASGHFVAFERFERWAERSVGSDVRLQGEPALRETVFAPLRRDHDVVWADVQVDTRQVLSYRTPLADAALQFTPIEAPTLGRVQVALCEACADKEQRRECVVIARPAGRWPARVRMAFCRSTQLQSPEPTIAEATAPKPAAAKLPGPPKRVAPKKAAPSVSAGAANAGVAKR
jgi:hypothetical protein